MKYIYNTITFRNGEKIVYVASVNIKEIKIKPTPDFEIPDKTRLVSILYSSDYNKKSLDCIRDTESKILHRKNTLYNLDELKNILPSDIWETVSKNLENSSNFIEKLKKEL